MQPRQLDLKMSKPVNINAVICHINGLAQFYRLEFYVFLEFVACRTGACLLW
jgi:hypothetical protein